jgi:conjugative transposon TraN protein
MKNSPQALLKLSTMKTHFFFCLLLVLLTCLGNAFKVNAQRIESLKKESFLSSYSIDVAFDKTTHLIFPYEIVYVDLGSNGIIADKVEKVENILKLKANAKGFKPTNLTVVTSSGNYYSFIVNYSDAPGEVSIVLDKASADAPPSSSTLLASVSRKPALNALPEDGSSRPEEPKAIFENIRLNQQDMDLISKKIIKSRRSIKDLGAVEYDMSFAANGIYIKDNAFFFHLFFENRSNVNYDIESVRFYIKDKKTPKRTATQEDEMYPVYTFNDKIMAIPGKMKLDRVYVMEKFTIPDDKVLIIELFEKKGGRNMSFVVNNDDIIKAKLIRL